MYKSDKYLKLIEKNNNTLFGQFLEKFQSINSSIIYTVTQEKYEGFVILFNCLNEDFFYDHDLHIELEKFVKNNSFKSVTYVKFENYNEKDKIEIILNQLLKDSEEIKKQKNTVVVELPKVVNDTFCLKTKFSKTFISNNRESKKLLFLTNQKSLIELYEKI